MKIYQGLEAFTGVKKPVLTIGTFDGVHIGHKKILEQLIQTATKGGGEAVVLTFSPHPRQVLFPDDEDLFLLNTIDEKVKLLAECGVKHLIIHPFTRKFSRIPYTEFVRDVLVGEIKVQKLIIGYNHQFGRNREGTFANLKSLSSIYGFELERIPAQILNKAEISSTKIRKALLKGDLITANKFLGYTYSFEGVVVKGKGMGKKLGYPTANILCIEKSKLIPANGIYAVRVEWKKKMYNGMMSIGTNPTVGGGKRTLEVNIFDFNKDIYGENIRIFFVEKLRDEKKFESLELLVKAIDKDKVKSLKILA